MAGVIGSLVSITAICGVVRPGESLAIGFIGSAIAIVGWQLLNKIHIDDPVGAISTHAGCSIWGMIAVGLFVEKDGLEKPFSTTYGAFKGGHVKILGVQLLACVSITAWTVVTVFIQLYIIDRCVGLRMSLEEEILGADAYEHGIDQSQENTEGHVKPVLASQNRVFPEQACEVLGNSETNSNESDSHIANERRCDNRVHSSEIMLYDQPITPRTSDDIPQRNQTDHQCSEANNKQMSYKKNNSAKSYNSSISSSRNRWNRIVLTRGKLNTDNEENKDSRGPSIQSKKSPVIIPLTPVDGDIKHLD